RNFVGTRPCANASATHDAATTSRTASCRHHRACSANSSAHPPYIAPTRTSSISSSGKKMGISWASASYAPARAGSAAIRSSTKGGGGAGAAVEEPDRRVGREGGAEVGESRRLAATGPGGDDDQPAGTAADYRADKGVDREGCLAPRPAQTGDDRRALRREVG